MLLKKCRFSATPMSDNEWGEGEEAIHPKTSGRMYFSRSGRWYFEFCQKQLMYKVCVVYVDGNPRNCIEFCGYKK